jgi:hypothetical protein
MKADQLSTNNSVKEPSLPRSFTSPRDVGEGFTCSTIDYLSRRLVAPEPGAKAEAVAKAGQLSLELFVHDLDRPVELLRR